MTCDLAGHAIDLVRPTGSAETLERLDGCQGKTPSCCGKRQPEPKRSWPISRMGIPRTLTSPGSSVTRGRSCSPGSPPTRSTTASLRTCHRLSGGSLHNLEQ